MIYQMVSYNIAPVTLAAGTEKVLLCITPPSSKNFKIGSLRVSILGAGSSDSQTVFKFGVLSGAAAGGTSVTGRKFDPEVAASIGSSCLDQSAAFTGTVPTLSAPVETIGLYPGYTYNPDKARGFIVLSSQFFGVSVKTASGGAAAPTVVCTVDIWEPV